ncbi:MAG TPA: hypothetical protein VF507_02080 [Pyrinomonadaceae bacterium]|jgi:hypothetical protein
MNSERGPCARKDSLRPDSPGMLMMKERLLQERMIAEGGFRVRRALLLAASFHLAATVGVYLTGRLGLLPSVFDRSGIGLFASDSLHYQSQAGALADTLKTQGLTAWLAAYLPVHVKLYSLSFALLGPLLGNNILAAEPLNLLYYLATLCLVFKIAAESFDRRAGLLAAGIVGLWPSLLLHGTQMLREQLFIAVTLAPVLILTRLLNRAYTWRRGLAASLAGTSVLAAAWLVRAESWGLVRAAVFLTACLFVVRTLRERRPAAGNVLCVSVLLLVAWAVPQVAAKLAGVPGVRPGVSAEQRSLPAWAVIAKRRQQFIKESTESNALSNIDTEVEFQNAGDVLRHVPRAAVVGFFAPFPRMWFDTGGFVGRSGRLLAGAETFLTYVIELLVVAALVKRRNSLSAWLLFLTAAAGVTALGMVVINVGTLYRMRYTFWVMLVVLGAEGLRQVSGEVAARRARASAAVAK